MLRELRVESYALIDNAAVEFDAGLNLLTGETGAGKSILIDALALLLGDKSSSEAIRHGAEKAVVSAVVEVDEHVVAPLLASYGVDAEGSELILRREIAPAGKSRVFINHQPATVAMLKTLAPMIAVVHAQNESLQAFDPAARLELLDGAAHLEREPLAAAYELWSSFGARIRELERGEQDKLRLLDLWSYQLKEIDAAALLPDEDKQLEAEKRVLANAERIREAALGAYDALYDSGEATLATLRAAIKHVEELSRFDARFSETLLALEGARAQIEDASDAVRDYADKVESSPERLEEIEERLALIDRMRRKYGSTIEEMLAFADDLRRKLNDIENKDEVLAELKKQQAAAATEYLKIAREASKLRYETARKLERVVESEINDLAMRAKFTIDVSGADEESNWTTTGFDTVAYLIATNPGEPMLPIEKIASGGEMSRVMLALKVSIEGLRGGKRRGAERTLIFDEIDAGVGGRAAEAIGKKLKALSRSMQVICITHLPQISSFADHHFLIEKREREGRTRTGVKKLDDQQRLLEVARMLSGAAVTDASLRNADQMIKANRAKRV